jgi:hypothetical protein
MSIASIASNPVNWWQVTQKIDAPGFVVLLVCPSNKQILVASARVSVAGNGPMQCMIATASTPIIEFSKATNGGGWTSSLWSPPIRAALNEDLGFFSSDANANDFYTVTMSGIFQ